MVEPLKSANYPHAPITEAVIEVRIAAAVDDKTQEKAVQRLKKRYPNSKALAAFNVNIDTTGGVVGVEQQPEGFRLSTDEQTDIVLVKPRGIAASRLAPYPGWPVLRDNAIAAWDAWKSVTPRHPIERVGIRYINRIDIPLAGKVRVRLEDYLNFSPQVTTIATDPMTSYVIQATFPVPLDKNWTTTITSTLVTPPPLIDHISLLLDIDVYRGAPLAETTLWDAIDAARTLKNDLFERCITDEARKLFA